MRGTLAAVALIVAGTVAAHADVLDDAKAAVTAKLKDPGSAMFSDVRAARDTNLVCGTVNAKNSLGGYVGAKEFRYVVNMKTAVIVGGYAMTGQDLDSLAQPSDVCR